LEVNEEMVNLWLDNTEEKLKKIPDIDPQKIRSEIIENISIVKSNMNNFYNNYKFSFNL
jgi:GMP synthase (glutamine-hydrolysing)